MGMSFYSVIARAGIDTTDFKRGLARMQNQAAQTQAGISKLFRAGGLRGGARFVGIGAPIYALVTAFRDADAEATKFEEEQKKIIDNNYKILDSLKPGTAEYKAALDAADNYSVKLQGIQRATILAGEDVKNAGGFLTDFFGGGAGVLDYIGRKLDVIYATAARTSALTVFGGNPLTNLERANAADDAQAQAELNDPLKDDQVAAKAKLLADEKIKSDKAREESAKELTKILGEQAAERDKIRERDEQDAAEKNPADFLASYKSQAGDLSRRLGKNAYSSDAPGQSRKLQDLKDLAAIMEKIDVLQKRVDDDADKAAKKASEDAAKLATASEKVADAREKTLALTTQEADAQKELADITQKIADDNFTDDDAKAKALDRQAVLTGRIQEINDRITEGKERQLEIDQKTKELADLEQEHAEKLLESIAPTDEEIRKGRRGTAQDRFNLQQADRDQQEAERLYDQAHMERQAAGQNRAGVNPQALLRKAAADEQQAQKLAGARDSLTGGTGSKEGLQQQVAIAEYRRGITILHDDLAKLQREVNNLKHAPLAAN